MDPFQRRAAEILMVHYSKSVLPSAFVSDFFTTSNACAIRKEIKKMYPGFHLPDRMILEYMLLTYMTFPPVHNVLEMNKNLINLLRHEIANAVSFEEKYQTDLKEIEDNTFLHIDRMPPAVWFSHKKSLNLSDAFFQWPQPVLPIPPTLPPQSATNLVSSTPFFSTMFTH